MERNESFIRGGKMQKPVLALCISALLLWGVPVLAADTPPGADPGGKWEEFSLSVRQLPDPQVATAKNEQVGMKINLPSQGGGFAVQVEGGSVNVDVNGDGNFDSKVKEGQIATLQVKFEDGEILNYFVRFFRVKNAICFESVTGLVGKVMGETVTLIDADCNGTFGDVEKDAILIGREKWAIPLGNVICIKDKLYCLKVDSRGKKASVQAYTGEVGTLDMMKSFKGPVAPQYVVVQSGSSYYNVSAKGGSKVPCGKYTFVKGRLDNGKKNCNIVRGQMKEFEVTSGSPCVPEWGPPLRIAFTPKLSEGGKLHIDASFQLFGKAEELYRDFGDAILVPEIQVKAKDGSVLKKDRFATG
jgi:hypothetical protein